MTNVDIDQKYAYWKSHCMLALVSVSRSSLQQWWIYPWNLSTASRMGSSLEEGSCRWSPREQRMSNAECTLYMAFSKKRNVTKCGSTCVSVTLYKGYHMYATLHRNNQYFPFQLKYINIFPTNSEKFTIKYMYVRDSNAFPSFAIWQRSWRDREFKCIRKLIFFVIHFLLVLGTSSLLIVITSATCTIMPNSHVNVPVSLACDCT